VSPEESYEFVLLALCVWREARGEPVPAKLGVAWSIKNRVSRPTWWGKDWASVILKPFQYSSFNPNDPNAVKWPGALDTSWQACLDVAGQVFGDATPDPTAGSTHYFDKSLDGNPPTWAKEMTHTVDIGALHFYK